MRNLRENVSCTLELFVQAFGRNTVDRRQIAIQNDSLTADFANQSFNSLNGGCSSLGGHGGMKTLASENQTCQQISV